jgi:hypothetical protein
VFGVFGLRSKEKATEMEKYRATTERGIDVMSKEFTNGTLARNNKVLVDTVAKYTDAHQEEVVLQVLQVGLTFHYPQSKAISKEHGEFLFGKSRKDLIERLDLPMDGTVRHAPKNLQRVSAVGCISAKPHKKKQPEKVEKADAKQKKQKAAAKTAKSAGDQEVALKKGPSTESIVAEVSKREAFCTNVETPSGQRPAKMFDEIVRVCFGPLVGIPKDKINTELVNNNVIRVFNFIYNGQVTLLGTVVDKWSVLAAELLKLTVHTHISLLSQVHWVLSEADGVDVKPEALLNLFNTKTVQQCPTEENQSSSSVAFDFLIREVATFAEDQKFIYEIIDVMKDRFAAKPEMPLYTVAKSQELYTLLPYIGVDLVKKARGDATASSTDALPKLNLIDFLGIVRPHIVSIIKPKWVTFAILISDVVDAAEKLTLDKTIEDLSIGIVADRAMLDSVVAAVPKVLAEVMRNYATGIH